MPEMPQTEIDALGGFRFLANKYGGSPQSIAKKIEDLEEDNRGYRVEITDLKNKLPKDGYVAVPQADVDKLAAYAAIGEPDAIKKLLKSGEEAQSSLAQIQTISAAKDFARAAGLADEAVDTLVAIPALKDAKFEVRKGKVKGSNGVEADGEVAYLTLAGDNQQAIDFEKALEVVPALKGLARRGAVKEESRTLEFVPQSGVKQEQESAGTFAEKALKQLKDRASAPNALRPAAK